MLGTIFWSIVGATVGSKAGKAVNGAMTAASYHMYEDERNRVLRNYIPQHEISGMVTVAHPRYIEYIKEDNEVCKRFGFPRQNVGEAQKRRDEYVKMKEMAGIKPDKDGFYRTACGFRQY